MGDAREAAFSAFVAARSPVLLRTAYLLTGDPGRADALLKASLAKTYLAWRRTKDVGAEAYVLRSMVSAQVSPWRRLRDRDLPATPLPEVPGLEDDELSAQRAALWTSLDSLPTKQRAALVLAHWVDLSDAEIGHHLGCSPGAAQGLADRGVEGLGGRLEPLQELFAFAASTVGQPAGLAGQATRAARVIRSRRRSGAFAGVAVSAALAVGVASLAATSDKPTASAAAKPSNHSLLPSVTPSLLPSQRLTDVLTGLRVLSAVGTEIFDGEVPFTLLPNATADSQISSLSRMKGGYVVTVEDHDRWSVDFVSAFGDVRVIDHRQRTAPGALTASTQVGVSTDGSTIAYALWDRVGSSYVTKIRLIDSAGKLLQTKSVPGVYSPVGVDDDQVWLDSEVNEPIQPALVWNRATGATDGFVPEGPTSVTSLDLVHGQATLANYVCLLSLVKVTAPRRVIAKKCDEQAVSFSPDGSVLISVTGAGDLARGTQHLQVRSTRDLHLRASLAIPLSVRHFSWTANGHFVFVGFGGTVTDLNPRTGTSRVHRSPSTAVGQDPETGNPRVTGIDATADAGLVLAANS